MNYELVKQLKEVGFPLKYDGIIHTEDEILQNYKAPTLSELIEACGEKHFSLQEIDGNWLCKGGEYQIAVVGKTKDEAVALLWLALNKK